MHNKLFIASVFIYLLLSTRRMVAEDLSKREANALVKNAHDCESFTKLAVHFGKEADRYDGLALKFQDELNMELAHPTVGSKFPNAADRTRRWQEYYRDKAQLMRTRESEYKKKAVLTEQSVQK